jgi:hypothetical protein
MKARRLKFASLHAPGLEFPHELRDDNLRDRQTSARATEALRIGATPATSMVPTTASTSSISPLRHHAESTSHP